MAEFDWSRMGRSLGSLLTVTMYSFIFVYLHVGKGTLILKFGDVLYHLCPQTAKSIG